MTRTLNIDIEMYENEPTTVYISDFESGDVTHKHFEDEDFNEWLTDEVTGWVEWMKESEVFD